MPVAAVRTAIRIQWVPVVAVVMQHIEAVRFGFLVRRVVHLPQTLPRPRLMNTRYLTERERHGY
jgi:hypothetical protein